MQIFDENGKVIADIDLKEGFSVNDLVKSIGGKKNKSALKNLTLIKESENKKQIVFVFENGEIFYDLSSKTFIRKNGVKIGEGSFNSFELNIAQDICERRNTSYFWVKLAEKTDVKWIKTFFGFLDIWANRRYNQGWLTRREAIHRNKIQRLCDCKVFFDSLESFSKIPHIQLLDSDGLASLYNNLLNSSREISSKKKIKQKFNDGIYFSAKGIKLDDWFLNNCSKGVSENYIDDEVLSNYLGDYIKCSENNLKHNFQYVFENYGGVITTKQIDKIKQLIDFGYEQKRLMDYLYRDIYAQGLEIGFKHYYDMGALSTLFDYARMNVDMKKDYDKYPRHLATMHDITQKNYKIEEDKILNEKFKNVVSELKNKKLDYSDDTYSIVIPSSGKDLVNEGQNLNHCVASYYKRMAVGETIVVFLRKKENIHQSLVTIEIKNNNIIQAKGNSNSNPKENEIKFIEKYKKHLELIR